MRLKSRNHKLFLTTATVAVAVSSVVSIPFVVSAESDEESTLKLYSGVLEDGKWVSNGVELNGFDFSKYGSELLRVGEENNLELVDANIKLVNMHTQEEFDFGSLTEFNSARRNEIESEGVYQFYIQGVYKLKGMYTDTDTIKTDFTDTDYIIVAERSEVGSGEDESTDNDDTSEGNEGGENTEDPNEEDSSENGDNTEDSSEEDTSEENPNGEDNESEGDNTDDSENSGGSDDGSQENDQSNGGTGGGQDETEVDPPVTEKPVKEVEVDTIPSDKPVTIVDDENVTVDVVAEEGDDSNSDLIIIVTPKDDLTDAEVVVEEINKEDGTKETHVSDKKDVVKDESIEVRVPSTDTSKNDYTVEINSPSKDIPLYHIKTAVVANEFKYEDVDSNYWAHDEIYEATRLGIVQGYRIDGENYFKPNEYVTRAQIVVMLLRDLGVEYEGYEGEGFKDTKGKWYESAIAKAKDIGVVKGFEDGTFRGHEKVRRDHIAQFIHRSYVDGSVGGENKFKDVSDSSSTYPAIRDLAELGVIIGDGKGNYKPSSLTTRAQSVTMLMRVKNVDSEFIDENKHKLSFSLGETENELTYATVLDLSSNTYDFVQVSKK